MSVSPTRVPRTTPPTEPRLLDVGGVITSSCRLSDYLLLLVGSIGIDRGDECDFWRFCDGEWMKLDATVLPLSASSEEGDALILIREPRVGTDFPAGSLVVHTETGEMALEPFDLETTFVDIATLARQHLQTGDEGATATLLARLLRGSANERRSRRRLSESLFEIREIVRNPLPRVTADPAEPRIAQVDAVWRLDDTAFYLQGWVKHEEAELTSLVAMSPEGERIELVGSAFRYRRPDVAEFFFDDMEERTRPAGFIAFLELAYPSLREDGWILELRDSDGGAVEVPMPSVSQDAGAARAAILADFTLEPPDEGQLKIGHISPAMDRLEVTRRRGMAIDAVDQHGTPPDDPIVSIIVPLFRHVEFLEQQLAQFVHDPEIAASDLVYVLGWLREMVEFYDATPGIGALSAKLLYEDESIQHAGIYFDRPSGGQVWSKEHLFKGLHRSLPAANVARPVPAVTGACLMISTALYNEVGGLSAEYVQGDYEDSDLCLRLAEAGRSSWYLSTVALYHLEGQSYPSTERELESQYNRWLHSSLWGERIPGLTGQLGEGS